MKKTIISLLAVLLCLSAVACEQVQEQKNITTPSVIDTTAPTEQIRKATDTETISAVETTTDSTSATTASSTLSAEQLWETKVDPVLRDRLLQATQSETVRITIHYYGPTEEEIEQLMEERWQIMKDIQAGSEPSQETTYTLPTEGNGIDNQIALKRGIAQELHLAAAQIIIDEFFPDESQIIYTSPYSAFISANATEEQIRALLQSPLVAYIQDYDSNIVSTTY